MLPATQLDRQSHRTIVLIANYDFKEGDMSCPIIAGLSCEACKSVQLPTHLQVHLELIYERREPLTKRIVHR